MQSTTSSSPSHSQTVSVSRIEAAALYSAFALIGAVVFGTLSIHPF